MGEFLKVTYKPGKGIKTEINMSMKHIDDAIRELTRIRTELIEEQRVRTFRTEGAAPRCVAPVVIERAPQRMQRATNAICFAIVGSVDADMGTAYLREIR